MKKSKILDMTDLNILRILSLYQHLDLLKLWYELGEDDAQKERMTKEEVSHRLESLMARGFVEQIKKAEGDIHWALKRGETKQ